MRDKAGKGPRFLHDVPSGTDENDAVPRTAPRRRDCGTTIDDLLESSGKGLTQPHTLGRNPPQMAFETKFVRQILRKASGSFRNRHV